MEDKLSTEPSAKASAGCLKMVVLAAIALAVAGVIGIALDRFLSGG